jgi:hypothetical protein
MLAVDNHVRMAKTDGEWLRIGPQPLDLGPRRLWPTVLVVIVVVVVVAVVVAIL